MTEAAARFRRWVVRWVDLVRRGAAAVVLAAVTATVAIGAYVVDAVTINTDTEDMLSAELPFRQNSRALSAAFPQFSDNILVVIDGATGDLADDAARLLAARLRERPALFGDVYDPAGEPFFRRHGLLYMDTDALEALADRLAEAQPFLGALRRDPTLRGLADMLTLAIDEILVADEDPPIDVAPVLTAMAEVAEARADGRFARLSWRQLMTGGDDGRRLILIQPVLDFGSLQPAAEAIAALRGLVAELGLDEDAGVRVRLTGSAALAEEELLSVRDGLGLAAVLSLTVVVTLLLFGLGSPRLALAIVATLLAGLVWTAGFAVAALDSLNLISVAFAVLFIGLSVDFGIHFGLRYKEAVDRGADHRKGLAAAAKGSGGALTLCAVAAAIGFFAFLPTDYKGLAELGLIAGTGMVIALITNTTVLPAMLTLMPLRPSAHRHREPAWRGARQVIGARAVPIAWGALAVAAAAAVTVPQARFDFDPLNLKDPETESVSTLFDLMADPETSPYTITVLAGDMAAAEDMARRLEDLGPVDGVRTIGDYVPANQDGKLDIIGTMALYLAPALAAPPKEPPDMAARRAALDRLRDRLVRLAAGQGAMAAARRLADALPAAPTDEVLRDLETGLLAGLPGRLDALVEALEAGPVTVDDLPAGLRERHVATDGRVRVQVFPRDDLRDPDALRRFVEAVRTQAPAATGSPVIILEAGRAVVRAFVQAAALALALIAVLLAALMRRPRDVLLVFAPLGLAALLTVAVSVLVGLPFNFANVIVLPLLFGLGVASGIHLVARERGEGDTGRVLRTSTPRAVVLSALTTIGSFGSMALSSHPGTSSMGVLLTAAIGLTLACTLTVLPALMVLWPRVPAGDR